MGPTHQEPPDRPVVGGRARRHEHAGHLALGQCPWHAVGGAARTGAGRAREDRYLFAEGAARAHRPRRDPQSRRTREDRGARLGGARLHDEGHRSPGHRIDRRAGDQPRGQRHGWRARLVRHRRVRSADRTGRRHAGQGRAELPRGAHGDGDRRGLRAADLDGSGRGEPDPRRAEHDGAARDRAGAVGARNEDSVSPTRPSSLRAFRPGGRGSTVSRSAACAAAAARARRTPTARRKR